MDDLKKFKVTELNEVEMVQISGGSFRKVVKYLWDALRIQQAINDFKEGWDSVECGCPSEKQIGN